MAIETDSVEEKEKKQRGGLITFRGTHNTFHPPVSYFALNGEGSEPKLHISASLSFPSNNCPCAGLKPKYSVGQNLTLQKVHAKSLTSHPPPPSHSSSLWECWSLYTKAHFNLWSSLAKASHSPCNTKSAIAALPWVPKVTQGKATEAGACVVPVYTVQTRCERAAVCEVRKGRAPPHPRIVSPSPCQSPFTRVHWVTGLFLADAGQLPHVLKIETGSSSEWLANAFLTVTDVFHQDNTRDVDCKQWRTFV